MSAPTPGTRTRAAGRRPDEIPTERGSARAKGGPGARRNLVIGCVGSGSMHRHWIARPEHQNFDLFLVDYDDGAHRWKADADYYVQGEGTKWELLAGIVRRFPEELAEYDRIWLPDDDILADTRTIADMFDVVAEHELDLAQPALDERSHVSHRITRRKWGHYLRLTNFAEVMAPVLSRRAFALCKHTFSLSRTGWGLDFLWPHLIDEKLEGGRVAVIDHLTVTHTRPINTDSGFYKALEAEPHDDMSRMIVEYDLSKQKVNYWHWRKYGPLMLKLPSPRGYLHRRRERRKRAAEAAG